MECDKNGEVLPKTITDLPGEDQWVIFNTQLSTLYKVNYDERNWKLLIETLTNGDFDRIHVINRAQLIDDALYLAWTGEQDYEIAMRLIEYLKREREYLPWKSAFENLKRMKSIIRQTPNYEFFKVSCVSLPPRNPSPPPAITFSSRSDLYFVTNAAQPNKNQLFFFVSHMLHVAQVSVTRYHYHQALSMIKLLNLSLSSFIHSVICRS